MCLATLFRWKNIQPFLENQFASSVWVLNLLSVPAYAFSRADGNPPRQFAGVHDRALSSAGYRLIRFILLESMPALQAKYCLINVVKMKWHLFSWWSKTKLVASF